MSLFSRLVLANEFAVDEEPEAVCETEPEAGRRGPPDGLLGALSEVMRNQDALTELNESLRAAQSGGGAETERILQRFLPWLDGFDRILEGFRSMEPTEEVNNWLKSLEGLYYRIRSGLERLGLEPMDCAGKEVDLECMEVVDYRASRDYPHNVVIHEMKRGYRYRGKILRDAQVVVASNERGL